MDIKQSTSHNSSDNSDEIDLLTLAKTIWEGRKTIIICLVFGSILGVIIAISMPKEFTSTTVMVPQMGENQSKVGGLSGLAALAGISLDMSQNSDLSPVIYPQILSSIPLQLELMNTPFHFSVSPQPITLIEYYTNFNKPSAFKKYTLGLPGTIIGAIKGPIKEFQMPVSKDKMPINLTVDQSNIKKTLDEILSLDVNIKEGYLTLSSKMPEALASAEITQKAQELLQKYITEFKIEKAADYLKFIQARYDESKAEFEKAQVSLAVVTDRNNAFTNGVSRIETERIQAKYTIAFSVYQELSKQLEQAKIQVKKETPVFTIIKPVSIPTEKSKPNRPMILIVIVFLSGIIGIALIFGKQFMIEIRKKWKSDVIPNQVVEITPENSKADIKNPIESK